MVINQPTRILNWPGCYNVRDLGGLPTVDGGVTRWRAIIRSDIPTRLTAEGRQALLDYGVHTILDLRETSQAIEEPSVFTLPNDDSAVPTYLNLPLETHEPAVSALMTASKDYATIYHLILDHYSGQVAQIMRAIGSAREGGILIHCHAGKDRTGILTALLLGLVGVPDEVIAADYAESQHCLWPLWEKIVEEAGGEDKADLWLKPLATVKTMESVLAHLYNRYGGVQNYLLTAGVTPAELAQVRKRLLC